MMPLTHVVLTYYIKNKISIATDLGHVTPEIFDKLSKSSFVLLESNYDQIF
ncbi:MAG: hypothetical protein ACLU2J_00155 [Clostridia bacterium]